MKPVALFVVLGVAVASNAMAQSASQFPPAPPPPGMNDPGVKAVAPPPAPAPAPAKKAPQPSADTAATLSQPATSQPRDARGDAPPTVKVHTEGDQTIQEYSRSGQVYMVVVTPKGGIPQTYMIDQKGAWTNGVGQPVKPVMYKVMEWGNSKSAADQDNGGQ